MTKYAQIANQNTVKGALTEQRKDKTKKSFYLADGQGLYLEGDLDESSAKPLQWRMQYKRPKTDANVERGIVGKSNRLSFGPYFTTNTVDPDLEKNIKAGVQPDHLGVSIKTARRMALEAREAIRNGADPADVRDEAAKAVAEARKALEQAQAFQARVTTAVEEGKLPPAIPGSFREHAEKWFLFKDRTLSKGYLDAGKRAFKNHVYPFIGDKQMTEITPLDFVPIREKHEAIDTIEALAEALSFASFVFEPLAESKAIPFNPVIMPKKLIANKRSRRTHRAAATEPEEIEKLLSFIYGRPHGDYATHALVLAMLTMQRINAVVNMRWSDIDVDQQMWVLPKEFLKLQRLVRESDKTKDHFVPLSTQACNLLRQIKAAQDKHLIKTDLVLPNRLDVTRPMDSSTPWGVLKRGGLNKLHTTHGFRAMARSAGKHDAKLDGWLLEVQLAHSLRNHPEANGLGEAYLRTEKFFRRREQIKARSQVVQQWADYLDTIQRSPWAPAKLKLAA